MAKPTTINPAELDGRHRLYVTKKNSRTMTEDVEVKKYDPVARKLASSSRKARSNDLLPEWGERLSDEPLDPLVRLQSHR